MSDEKTFTITNGLSIGPRDKRPVSFKPLSCYFFRINHRGYKECNILYEPQVSDDKDSFCNNTDSKCFPARWRVSTGRHGEPLDPWCLWEQANFDLSQVQVTFNVMGAAPWLLSFRPECSPYLQAEKAALDDYHRRVARAERLLQLSLQLAKPPKSTAASAVRRESFTESSLTAIAASPSSSFNNGTDKAAKTTPVKVTSVASAATGQAPARDPVRKGWRKRIWKKK